MAESFVFYRSFLETINMIPDSEQRKILLDAIIKYGLDGEETTLPFPLDIVMHQIIASIDGAQKRYQACVENGRKGGRPKTQEKPKENQSINLTKTKEKPKTKPEEKPKEKPKENLNKNDNKNVNVNDNDIFYYHKKCTEDEAGEKTLDAFSPSSLPKDFVDWASEESDYNGGKCRNYWNTGGTLSTWVYPDRKTNMP